MLLGMAVSPIYCIPLGTFAGNFGGPSHCGKLSSMVEAVAVCWSAVAYFVGGFVIQRFGWNLFFLILTFASLIGALSMIWFQYLEMPPETLPKPMPDACTEQHDENDSIELIPQAPASTSTETV